MKETLKRIKADIIVSALLCIALGIVLLVWPAETIDVFCKILAVGLIIMGGVDIASYFMNRSIHPFAGALGLNVLIETKRNGYEKWWSMLIIAAVSLVFGVLCIVNAFGMVKLALQFIGIALIYDGISDLWVANRAVHAAKMMKQEAEAVDVDYKEI